MEFFFSNSIIIYLLFSKRIRIQEIDKSIDILVQENYVRKPLNHALLLELFWLKCQQVNYDYESLYK